MTIFCGCLYLGAASAELATFPKQLKSILQDSAGCSVSHELLDERLSLYAMDFGAFAGSGWAEDADAVTLIVGDPICSSSVNRSRAEDLQILHANFSSLANGTSELANCRGHFAGIHYRKKTGEMFGFTDKVGVRPFYYYQQNDWLIFSSTIKYINRLQGINLEFSLPGAIEQIALMNPLGTHTPRLHISLLRSGEMLRMRANQVDTEYYFRFANVKTSTSSYEHLVGQAYEEFNQAVALRHPGSDGLAFLSGGLDSRCVTAALRPLVNNLYTFNFATTATQDQTFARLYAESASINHIEQALSFRDTPNWSQIIVDAMPSTEAWQNDSINKKLIWSGDGGSVAVGCVYLTQGILDTASRGDLAASVDDFLATNDFTLPKRLFKEQYTQRLQNILTAGMLAELKDTGAEDPLSQWYLYLLHNDQRRHMHQHFETIDEHQVELQLPFLDGDFLRVIKSVPLEKCLYHRFFMDWFGLFPEFTRQTPWQTYPEHVPCPIESDSDLMYQWNPAFHEEMLKLREQNLPSVPRLYLQGDFSKQYLSPSKVLLAWAMHKLSIRDYSYLTGLLSTTSKY